MSWYKVKMSVDDVTSNKHAQLQEAFEACFYATLSPRDAALFHSTSIHQDLTLYFSPGAVRVAQSLIARYGGIPCEAPPASTGLLVGRDNARERLLGHAAA